MRKVIITFLLAWATLFATLIYLGGPAEAADWLELQDVSITYRSYFPGAVEPLVTQNSMAPGKNLGKELNVDINSDIFDYLYWNNTVHSYADENSEGGGGQFRVVGWEFGLGVDFRKIWRQWPVSFGYYHWSTHILDASWGLGHFPVRDSLELRIYLYDRQYR